MFNPAGVSGFVIRIPCGRLTVSATASNPSLPSNIVDRTGFNNSNISAQPPQEDASTLEAFDTSMPWGNMDAFTIGSNIVNGVHEPSNMPSSLPNGFSASLPQVLDFLAMNMEDDPPMNYVQEPSIASWHANIGSPSKGINEPVTEIGALTKLEMPTSRIPCGQLGCTETFSRPSDRIRHFDTVHHASHSPHLCPVAGCTKNRGRGYSRADKLTEHLWRKHADLGYKKAGS